MDNLKIDKIVIDGIFVNENDIPEQYHVPVIHQREYLLNGELVSWTGAVTEIFSPIFVPGAHGLERRLLGSVPHTSSKEAMEALNAAVSAYGDGQGIWPTMSVEGRIKCMQKFVGLMIVQRDLVIKLLMWEI